MTHTLVPGTVICVTKTRRTKKMRSEKRDGKYRMDCALYREEKRGGEYSYLYQYCDGLEDAFCRNGRSCPFYKWREKWRPIVVRKQTQYVRIEE